ncbi:MAG: NAD-dependent epimerase/dehydratase family protein [Steroidobacteraceae bacterium]
MQIAVTGATGFIGRNFVELAASRGHRISAIHRPGTPAKRRLNRALQSSSVDLRASDVRDSKSLAAAMTGAECAIHFAAAFRESGVPNDYFLTINVTGTRNAIEAAAEQGVRRFVFCSTAGIYGSRLPGIVDESAKASPENIYERSKVEAEEVVRTLSASRGIEYAILRPAVVYGPHDDRLIKMFRAAARGRFPQFGPGKGRRHMVFVADVARAGLRACVLPEAAGQEMIVAGPRAVPLREILAILARALDRSSCGPRLPLWPMQALAAMTEDACGLLGIKPPIYRRRMDFYSNDAGFDCSHAFDVLGWKPAVDLDEGFYRTIASYRQEGLM